MKQRLLHIICRIPGILLAVLVMDLTAVAQKPVPHYELPQCDTLELSVVDWPGDRYTWDIYSDSSVNFATESGDIGPVPFFVNDMYEGFTVQITGLPTGRYYARVMVWDEVQCTNNLMVFMFDVIEQLPYAELYGDSVCYGEPVKLKVVFTGTGPWDLIYTYGDGTVHLNLNTDKTEYEFTPEITALPVGTTEFFILQVTDQCTVNDQIVEKEVVHIYPRPSTSRIYVADMIRP
jgi:hypothetical protein